MKAILYPHDYFKEKKVDEDYLNEAETLSDIIETYTLKTLPAGREVLYRGWMLSPSEYIEMTENVVKKGSALVVDVSHYHASHYLSHWYEELKDLTPLTVFTNEENLAQTVHNLKWSQYFIKDEVKSLTTQRGSVATSLTDIQHILVELKKYRTIEGQLALREVHDFINDTEQRYFSVNGQVFSNTGNISDLVTEVARRMKHLSFISIDTIMDSHGKEWLVEIGDGQVSGLKEWSLDNFKKVIEFIQS